jgi:hypothetical protein
LGHADIAPASGFQGLEPRIEAALLFIEQAVEENDRGAQLIGQDGRRGQRLCNPEFTEQAPSPQ